MEIDGRVFIKFSFRGWKHTGRYSYTEPPSRPGVYILAVPEIIDGEILYEILYIGSSTNISRRHNGHEKKSIAGLNYDFYRFFFKECDNYLEYEKELIKLLNPKYNKYGKQKKPSLYTTLHR